MAVGPQHSAALTHKELEVLRLICSGLRTKQIAQMLGVSPKTVAKHRYTMMQKAGAGNAVQLLRWGIKSGFVSVE